MKVCINTHMHVCTMSKIVGLATQFATQNCLGCYLKLNLDSKFQATHARMYNVQNSRARIAICYSKLSWLLLKIEFG